MATKTALTFGSLFAGIGGIDLGLERAGMTCKWQVEIDDYATKVLQKHWPNVARIRDVRDCGAHNLKTVDLICGGFPCQDVSLAGKRAGLGGKRTTLWSEFYRIICEVKPRWVLAENVPGLLSSDAGGFFGQILRDLAQGGYDASWRMLSAAEMGAPHRRNRVFIVAYTPSGRLGRQGQGDQDTWMGFTRSSQGQSRKGAYEDVAYARYSRCGEKKPNIYEGEPDPARGSDKVAHTNGQSLERTPITREKYHPWTTEPDVDRVVDGIPNRVDRLRGLGNAVVPQVAEWIGRQIVESERQWQRTQKLQKH